MFLVMSVLLMAREDRPVKKRETFRDRLTREHPEFVDDDIYRGGCAACPSSYGYESVMDGVMACKEMGKDCTACWNREVKR